MLPGFFLEICTMRKALSLSAAALVMLVSAKASAGFHVMKVVEVFPGSAAAPNASYVQLQMYSAGQTFVSGHVLHVYAANGTEITTAKVTFSGNVANGSDQANILIGTSSVAAAFGVAPDFTLPENLDKTGGAVCFEGIDCFTWGNFTGTTADITTLPFTFPADKAARRSIGGGASATLLEDADDTQKSSVDFAAVTPAPKNNNGAASDGGITPTDAGPDSSTPPNQDSGIGTKPSPNNPTVTPDSGTSSSGGSSSGDDGGCNVTTQSSDGWSTGLGLFAAASMLAMSRRRRKKG